MRPAPPYLEGEAFFGMFIGMFKREDTYERVIRGEDESIPKDSQTPRLPGRLARGAKARKKTKAPAPLSPDAKRYNDDIPDPESEVTVPE